jgi:hypothetical protein
MNEPTKFRKQIEDVAKSRCFSVSRFSNLGSSEVGADDFSAQLSEKHRKTPAVRMNIDEALVTARHAAAGCVQQ